MKANMTTSQVFEMSLYGTIDKSQLNKLKIRLCGICGESDRSEDHAFASWEVVHIGMSTPHSKTESETVKSKTRSTTKAAELNIFGIAASHLQPVPEKVHIRVLSDLSSSRKDLKQFDVREWKYIKHEGRELISNKERTFKTFTKPVNFSKIYSENVLEYLQAIQVGYEYEFIKKGYRFYTPSQICISVYQIYSMAIAHAWDSGPENIKCIDEDNYLVEMNCTSPLEGIRDMEPLMLQIADNLSSIVLLTKDLPSQRAK